MSYGWIQSVSPIGLVISMLWSPARGTVMGCSVNVMDLHPVEGCRSWKEFLESYYSCPFLSQSLLPVGHERATLTHDPTIQMLSPNSRTQVAMN